MRGERCQRDVDSSPRNLISTTRRCLKTMECEEKERAGTRTRADKDEETPGGDGNEYSNVKLQFLVLKTEK